MNQAGKTAAIHDLGYKRYVGTRRPQRTRWRVIVKNLVGTSWRGWWRMKLWVIGGILTTVGVAAPMYLAKYVFGKLRALTSDFQRDGVAVNLADALLPMSLEFYTWFAFVLGATVAAAQVARDLRAGAFEFYFSRPVRPIDYLIGKVAGTALVMGTVLAAGPIVLSLFRVGLSQNSDELMTSLAWVPRAAIVGVLGALAYAIVPLAMSTLSPRPRLTIAMWVGFYVVFSPIVWALSEGTGHHDLAALHLKRALLGLAYGLFDVRPMFERVPSLTASLEGLLFYIVAGLAVLYLRLRSAERAGLGGG